MTNAVINCCQTVLKQQYPHIGGLQNTCLGDTLTYIIETGEFVQVMNESVSHWITVSNIGCIPITTMYMIVYNVKIPHHELSVL